MVITQKGEFYFILGDLNGSVSQDQLESLSSLISAKAKRKSGLWGYALIKKERRRKRKGKPIANASFSNTNEAKGSSLSSLLFSLSSLLSLSLYPNERENPSSLSFPSFQILAAFSSLVHARSKEVTNKVSSLLLSLQFSCCYHHSINIYYILV